MSLRCWVEPVRLSGSSRHSTSQLSKRRRLEVLTGGAADRFEGEMQRVRRFYVGVGWICRRAGWQSRRVSRCSRRHHGQASSPHASEMRQALSTATHGEGHDTECRGRHRVIHQRRPLAKSALRLIFRS